MLYKARMTESRDPGEGQGLRHHARRVVRGIRGRIGVRDQPHDRYLLERVIFPALSARAELQRILFVGCDRSTRHYPETFADREFVTIDVDPAKARYGAERHVVDSLVNLGDHFKPGRFDAVICNGVFGWGLDSAEEIDAAVRQCHKALRPGGLFIVGWNDVEPRRPPPLDTVPAFRRFESLALPPFPGPVYPTFTALRHVYAFYRRPAADGESGDELP
jgi:SAM-dependent methyltransferase